LDVAGLSAADVPFIFGGNSGAYAQNKAEEITLTAQYNLWANVISRLELRWDHMEHGNPFGANDAGAPFRSSDYLIALNVIYQF